MDSTAGSVLDRANPKPGVPGLSALSSAVSRISSESGSACGGVPGAMRSAAHARSRLICRLSVGEAESFCGVQRYNGSS